MRGLRLLLVRHGETAWVDSGQLQGALDIPLSETGRQQVTALAPRLAREAPELWVTSPLKRAWESAQILDPAAPWLAVDGLRESSLGSWEGRLSRDIIAEAPEHYRDWRAGRASPPGGEPIEAFDARVLAALEPTLAPLRHPDRERAGSGDDTALVVCHGGVIRVLLRRLLGLDVGELPATRPAGLTIVRGEATAYDAPLTAMTWELEDYDICPSGD